MKKSKCEEGLLVKILPSNGSATNSFDGSTLRMSSISSPKEMDEYVVLQSKMYKEIFKNKKINADDDHKRLSVVKICYAGKSIHRAFYSASAEGFNQQYVGLSTNSIYLLSHEKELEVGSKVCLSKGSVWRFYWDNPNAAVRMAFRIGVIGIVITLIGVNLTNICTCISNFADWISCMIHCNC